MLKTVAADICFVSVTKAIKGLKVINVTTYTMQSLFINRDISIVSGNQNCAIRRLDTYICCFCGCLCACTILS